MAKLFESSTIKKEVLVEALNELDGDEDLTIDFPNAKSYIESIRSNYILDKW